MGNTELNLANLLNTVGNVLLENKATLNEADSYNHDHGNNMVEIFKIASQAVSQNKDMPPAQQLKYAGEQVQSQMKSGSAQLYAEGFQRAAQQFQNQKQFQPGDVMQLVQALMGAGQNTPQTSASPSDSLSALLGSLGSSLTSEQTPQPSAPTSQDAGGIDINNIMAAGMAFLQSQQRGESTTEALLDAFIAGSQMSSSPARTQSGKLVANTLLQAISALGK